MKLQPINGRILIKPIEAKKRTSSGIYLPDTAKEKVKEGEVIAVADDATEEVAVSNRIIYREFSGTKVKFEGEDYVLLSDDDLLAKYEEVDKIPE
jgi:chaperonin GroES